MKLTILGTGSATPTLLRNPSAQILSTDFEKFLIDCGEGTQNQLLRNKIKVGKIKNIFISHLHGDHYFGLIGLISSLNLSHRTEPLTVFGPKGLDEAICLQLKLAGTSLNFQLNFETLSTEVHYKIFENEHINIYTIPLIHRVPCCGFLFLEKPKLRSILADKLPIGISTSEIKQLKEGKNIFNDNTTIKYNFLELTTEPLKQKSFAYCSDTIFNTEIVNYLKNVSLLYHEATFKNEHSERAKSTFHSTAAQAAEIAKTSKVDKLLIGHFSSRYIDLSENLIEAQAVFKNTELAIENETYII